MIGAALERASLAPDRIDEVLMGCVLPAGQGQAPARQAGFILRRRLGRLQVERAGRRAFGIGDEAEPGDPGDIGRLGIVG